MGRKGVSIRKPKKSRPISTDSIGGYSNTRTDDSSPVHSLVKDKSGAPNRGGTNPSAESNKKRKGR